MTQTGTTYGQVRSADFSTLKSRKFTGLILHNQLLSPGTFTSGKTSVSVL